MKLNLGCGFKKKDGFINVDQGDFCSPDVICRLDKDIWPWPENSVSEVEFIFSLEQMGELRSELLHVIKELYRVCRNEAVVKVVFANPRHDRFVFNPLNTHRLSYEFFVMFDVQTNLVQIGNGDSDNCLGLQLGVNFVVENFKTLLAPEIYKQMESGEWTEEQVRQRLVYENNICQANEVVLRVVKQQ